jgi:putative addiction module component
MSMMTATLDSIFAAAMSLDADSRRDLAERLWDEVQTKDDAIFSEDTWNEIGRRVTASDAGNVEHISGAVALAQVRAAFGLPSAG